MDKGNSDNQIQERGKISAFQLSLLVFTAVISTSDVFLPAFVAQEAKQDSWISVLIGTALSLIVINVFLTLGLKYPNRTLIQYSSDIMGKLIGKLIGFLYILYFLSIAFTVTRQMEELFVSDFNPNAPIIPFGLISVAVAAYALFHGLEVIARVNEFLLPFGLLILLFIAIINIPNMDFNNFLPILYKGIYPVVKGGLLIQGWVIEIIFLLQIIPFITNKNKIRKYISISTAALGISLETGVLVIAVFGPITGKLIFPALNYIRFASLGPYIHNLDISILVVWIAGIFIKISIFYYVSVHSISQLFGFKSYKSTIVPVGVLLVLFSVISFKMLSQVLYFLHFIYPVCSFMMAFIIPCLLLFTSFIKDKLKGSGSKPKAKEC